MNTLVIGGSQAGLAVGYELRKRGLLFEIVDAGAKIGDTWRSRWDSLRLFTPAKFSGLPGMDFPAPSNRFPTKDDMAAFLETYAARFELPVTTGVRVTRLAREDGRLVAETSNGSRVADNAVVAMASFQRPKIPAFAADLAPDIVQLHSRDYKNPQQLRPGSALVVGAGNSGAEIALDVAPGREVWLAGRHPGNLPFKLDSPLSLNLLAPFIIRVVFHHVMTTSTPMGRRARPKVLAQGGPLIRIRPGDYERAGVERVGRVTGVEKGAPVLSDGRQLAPANVIWCTGYEPGFDWIDMPIMGDHEPRHERGVVPDEPGLYFVGLEFLYSFSSTMIHGMGRDAAYVAEHIACRAA